MRNHYYYRLATIKVNHYYDDMFGVIYHESHICDISHPKAIIQGKALTQHQQTIIFLNPANSEIFTDKNIKQTTRRKIRNLN